jgi:preprotein translocase subunit SecF
MNLTRYNNFFFILPVVLSVVALVALLVWPPKLSLDLAGGSLIQVTYPDGRPALDKVVAAISPLNLGEVRVQPTGTNSYTLRERSLNAQEKVALEQSLGQLGPMQEDLFTSISPTIGTELLNKGLIALAMVTIAIILFIAFAFRHVSKPVASWKYGVVAIVTLVHDVLIPVGLFAVLGHFLGAEIDSLFIVALLTILGISINDTIVVFDRIRENLSRNERANRHEDFAGVVGRSITQTLARSINTSLTVVIVLLALVFVGPLATRDFALTLTVGMIAGTYSSIFLAAPLLVLWNRLSGNKK